MLAEYIEGVTAKLEEAEADLVDLEDRIKTSEERLKADFETLPGSPLEALLRWGWRPLRWPHVWARCHRAQTLCRQIAHLLRARLAAQQTLWLYQTILPLYQQLAQAWQAQAGVWRACRRQIETAREAPLLQDWPARLETALSRSGGPWTAALVEQLHAAAPDVAQVDLERWATEALAAGAIIDDLCAQAETTLTGIVELAVDAALLRQLPDDGQRADWLAAILEQARPFWRYDETALSELTRSRASLTTWLLLPQGERSPLAPLCRDLPNPPLILPGPDASTLIAISLRQGITPDPPHPTPCALSQESP